MAGDVVRQSFAVTLALVSDLDGFHVERGEHQLHLAADQRGVDLEGVAVQRHRRGLGDRAVLRPQERLGQIGCRGHRRGPAQPRPAAVPALQRGLPGLGMHAAVVLGFDPRGQQPVERQQCGAVISARRGEAFGGGIGDLDEELFTHGAEEPFDLPAPLGLSG